MNAEQPSTFGALLKHLRLRADLSQSALAERAGLSERTISDLERGLKLHPHPHTVTMLAGALGLTQDEATALDAAACRRRGARRSTEPPTASAPASVLPAPSAVPPRPESGPRASTLPIPPTPLVGRAEELATVTALLADPAVRLLTLAGPPGVGKTRLALEVASRAQGCFRDGVHFVSLAAIHEGALVARAVAAAVEVGGADPTEQRLTDGLRPRQCLLLLDNFEQLLDAAPLLSHWLAACPALKLLVTSRAALRLRGERRFTVPPLSVPEPHKVTAGVETVLAHGAVQLFVARAADASPDFALTPENMVEVAQICARLDGLPLAIELVAARAGTLAPSEMLARLGARLDLPAHGALDMPERHRTLREAISWSYNRLNANERRLLDILAVFENAATLEAVEAVCATCQPDLDVLDGLTALIENSLLRRVGGRVPAGTRFEMLETIREFARERLDAPENGRGDGGESVRRAHADYFLALSERAEGELQGPRQAEWLDRLEAEHPNLRTALRWTLARQEAELAMRLSGGLWRFWLIRGYQAEGRRLLATALALPGAATTPLRDRAQALVGAGVLAFDQSEYETAASLCESGLAVACEAGDDALAALAHFNLGMVAFEQAKYDRAGEQFRSARRLREALADRLGVAQGLLAEGELARVRGDLAGAEGHYQQCLALFRDLQNVRYIAIAVGNLGLVAFQRGEIATAGKRFRESLALAWDLGDRDFISLYLEALAAVMATGGSDQEAALLWSAADELRERMSITPHVDRVVYAQPLDDLPGKLGLPAFADACSRGRALSLEQAVALALEPKAIGGGEP